MSLFFFFFFCFIYYSEEMMKRERESMYKYKRDERKQFQSVAYFLSQLLFQADEFCLNFFFERICSHKQQQRTTTPILIEQSLFVVIT